MKLLLFANRENKVKMHFLHDIEIYLIKENKKIMNFKYDAYEV